MGYTSYWTSMLGGVYAVYTKVTSLPQVSMTSSGWIGFMVNTGNLLSCSGFMQVGVFYDNNGGGWKEGYMNADSNCALTHFTNQISSVSPGDNMELEISQSGTNTIYSVKDDRTGASTNVTVITIGQWDYNSFQTMTEAQGDVLTKSDFSCTNSYVSDVIKYYITTDSYYMSDPARYGGACTTSANIYNIGTWQNSIYGYDEPQLNTRGHCVDNVHSYGTRNGGGVNNPSNIVGTPDGSFAQLGAGNYGDSAFIEIDFGAKYSGTISVLGYSYNNGNGAYNSHVLASVSSDGSSWSSIYSSVWSPSNGNNPTWITLGVAKSIRYVNITVADDLGDSANVFLDAMSLGCECVTGYVSSGTGGTKGGTVSNPTNIIGAPDNTFSVLYAPNSGDSATIEADFGSSYSGSLALFGYSFNNGNGAYYSYVSLSVSTDGSKWTQINPQTWNPSSSNTPTWVQFGSVNNIRYVKVTVTYHNGYSASLHIDSVTISQDN
jgi:hypothetical protein